MAVRSPASIPKKHVSSLDITGFSGGYYMLGQDTAKGNQIVDGHNVSMAADGSIVPAESLTPWLPDTEQPGFQIYPVIWNGQIYNFTADNGRIRYVRTGEQKWTDCVGENSLNTTNGGKPIFLRIMDELLVINGGNGDRLMKVRLRDMSVIKYKKVANPTTAPSASATGITNSGSYKIYYGYTYSSATGETELSPILTYTINKPRDIWKTDGSEYLTVTRTGTVPENAHKWNLYAAIASTGGTIKASDMILLAGGLDLAQTSITDNGTLAFDIGRGNPPTANSTAGPRVRYGIETNGRPVLFGDVDDPHSIHIGGDGEHALDFSVSNGGFRATPSRGTNYYPAALVGFRNGQGIPSLTILFSNTQGLSKQATLEQQTVTFGQQSFVVWGVTEQNYGAAGVASALAAVNYKGQLSFISTDGFNSMDTEPQLQNVIATKRIDKEISPYVNRIKNSSLSEIVGTAWGDRVLWIVPADGFDKPNEILVRDLNNHGAWNVPLRIPATWIGTVSPPDSPAFVYVRQGRKTFKFFQSFATAHYSDTGAVPFSTAATGALIGFNEARNGFQALVQAVFYIVDLIGEMTIGVRYRNQNGKIKERRKKIKGPSYAPLGIGGWDSPHAAYSQLSSLAGWSAAPIIPAVSASVVEGLTKRHVITINDLASEVQWFFETPPDYCNFKLRRVSYEGENLGVKPDLR